MAILRVDPAATKRRTRAREVGGYIGSLWGPVGGAIGSGAGWVVDKIIGKPKPARVYELDTDTGEVSWPTKGGSAQAAVLDLQMRNVERDLEAAWQTGVIPATLPKKYRAGAELLVSERPTTTTEVSPSWSQYMPTFTMPPGGVQGFAQMTPASRLALTGGRSRSSKRRRRKSRASSKTRRSTRRTTSSKRASSRRSTSSKKLVKGSAAAKRFMARLRAKRRK